MQRRHAQDNGEKAADLGFFPAADEGGYGAVGQMHAGIM
jgi:hypothetical protein